MSESTDFVAMPKAISGALSGAGNLQVIIPVHGRKSLSLQEFWDGTLVGVPQIWTSNNFIGPGNGSAAGLAAAEARANWTEITDATIVTFLTTAPSAGGGKPNSADGGTAPSAALVIPVTFAAIRWRLTWTSGSGNYTLDAEAR